MLWKPDGLCRSLWTKLLMCRRRKNEVSGGGCTFKGGHMGRKLHDVDMSCKYFIHFRTNSQCNDCNRDGWTAVRRLIYDSKFWMCCNLSKFSSVMPISSSLQQSKHAVTMQYARVNEMPNVMQTADMVVSIVNHSQPKPLSTSQRQDIYSIFLAHRFLTTSQTHHLIAIHNK